MPNQCESIAFTLNSLFLCRRNNPAALSLRNWKVYSGVVSLDSLPAVAYSVEKIILNEDYNNKTNDQDIALLKLTSQVTFNGQSQLYSNQIVCIFSSYPHEAY